MGSNIGHVAGSGTVHVLGSRIDQDVSSGISQSESSGIVHAGSKSGHEWGILLAVEGISDPSSHGSVNIWSQPSLSTNGGIDGAGDIP